VGELEIHKIKAQAVELESTVRRLQATVESMPKSLKAASLYGQLFDDDPEKYWCSPSEGMESSGHPIVAALTGDLEGARDRAATEVAASKRKWAEALGEIDATAESELQELLSRYESLKADWAEIAHCADKLSKDLKLEWRGINLDRVEAERSDLERNLAEWAGESARGSLRNLFGADARCDQGSLLSVPGVRRPDIPFVVPTRSNVVFAGDPDAARSAVGAYLLRVLHCRPPGQIRLTFADPTFMGNSLGPFFSLLRVPQLAGDSPAVSKVQIDQALDLARSRVASVNSQALQGKFANIDDFNASQDRPEHYSMFVCFGLPGAWTPNQVEGLAHLAEMGTPAGVMVVASVDSAQQVETNMRKALDGLTSASNCLTVDSCKLDGFNEVSGEVKGAGKVGFEVWNADADPSVRARLETLASEAETQLAPSVSADDLHVPDDRSTKNGILVPVGIGANKTVFASFEDTPAHGLVIGGTGSGKSTLLNTLIYQAARVYPLTELELWLIDLKQGSEFHQYADGQIPGLPHARVVASAASPAFAVNVLSSLCDELKRRSDLFKSKGVSSLSAYRDVSGQEIPRILCVIDECQKLLDGSLPTKQRVQAASCFRDLTMQGRSYGVHLLLATQSLAGLGIHGGELAASWRQVDLRIALRCAPQDIELLFGDKNKGAIGLAKKGDAVLNSSMGAESANQRFQVAYIPPDKAQQLRRELSERHPREHPQVVFDGTGLAAWSPMVAGPVRRISLGKPLSLEERIAFNAGGPTAAACVGPKQGCLNALVAAALDLRTHDPNAHLTFVNGFTGSGDPEADVVGRLGTDIGATVIDSFDFLDFADSADQIAGHVVAFGLDRMRIRLPDTRSRSEMPPVLKVIERCKDARNVFLGSWSTEKAARLDCGVMSSAPSPFDVLVFAAGSIEGERFHGRVSSDSTVVFSVEHDPGEAIDFLPWALPDWSDPS
jgi:hypothetical protein